ncbi:uncharacterized protein METZ01_LOCUS363419, partial [marine metagenome]
RDIFPLFFYYQLLTLVNADLNSYW